MCWFLASKTFVFRITFHNQQLYFLFSATFDANSATHLEIVIALHDNEEKHKSLKLTEFGVFM